MIRVVCGCGRAFRAEDRHARKWSRCPVCGTRLLIGEAPASRPSGEGLGQVPSWWYPTEPQDEEGSRTQPVPSTDESDALRTAVSPIRPDPALMSGSGSYPRQPMSAKGVGVRGPGRSVSRVRRLWALSVGTTTLAVLALAAILWMRSVSPRGREATAAPGAAAQLTVRSGTAVGESIASGAPARGTRRLRLLVPAYFYPKGDGRKDWQRLIDAAAKVDVVAIANPDSGPGRRRDLDYTAVIAEAGSQGVQVIGYVSTQYARRDPAEVKSEIDAWVRYYPQITGFFLDQQDAGAQHAAYYNELCTYARGKLKDPLVVANPGTPCDAAYLVQGVADVTCVFTNSEGFETFELPELLKGFEPSRFAALAYQISGAEAMRAAVEDAIVKRMGYLYITDGTPSQPWSKLPAYWEAEVDAVGRVQ